MPCPVFPPQPARQTERPPHPGLSDSPAKLRSHDRPGVAALDVTERPTGALVIRRRRPRQTCASRSPRAASHDLIGIGQSRSYCTTRHDRGRHAGSICSWPRPGRRLRGCRLAHEKALGWLPVALLGAAFTLAAPVLYAAALQSMGTSQSASIAHRGRRHQWPLCVDSKSHLPAMDLLLIGAGVLDPRPSRFTTQRAAPLLFVHGIAWRGRAVLREHYGDAFNAYRQRVRRYGSI
jgi:hypothetical protein